MKSAKEFLIENGVGWESVEKNYPKLSEAIKESMIGFAKYHVKKALEAAFNNYEMKVSENDDDTCVTITVSRDSIINAYPLNKIK